MKRGRLHVAGPAAWPDQLLEAGRAFAGFVLCVGPLLFGFELCRSGDRALWWVNVYAGWWAFEICVDVDGVLEDDEWDDELPGTA